MRMNAPSWMNASWRAANLADPSFWGCAMKCSRRRPGCLAIAPEMAEATTPLAARSAGSGVLAESRPFRNESVAAGAMARASGARRFPGAGASAAGENPPRLIPAMLLNLQLSSVRLGMGSDSKRE
jgi:hypothetical protein